MLLGFGSSMVCCQVVVDSSICGLNIESIDFDRALDDVEEAGAVELAELVENERPKLVAEATAT